MAFPARVFRVLLLMRISWPSCHPKDAQLHQNTSTVHVPCRKPEQYRQAAPFPLPSESRLPDPEHGQKLLPSFPPFSMAAAAISARISSRDSVRGSSAVKIVKSARPKETSAIKRRFSRSLKPAEPNTAITFPCAHLSGSFERLSQGVRRMREIDYRHKNPVLSQSVPSALEFPAGSRYRAAPL